MEIPNRPTTRLYRSEKHRVLGGVCSGMAMSRGYSVSLVRMVALALFSLSAVGLLFYVAALFLMPKASAAGIEESDFMPMDPLKRSPHDAMLAGVCAGLAKVLKMDVALVRILYVCITLVTGIGIMPYLYAWVILPKEPA